MLGSGTSPNEALHSEINRWFRPQTNKYAATLQMQLHVNQYSKFVAHNAAMYRPTLRWKSSAEVLIVAASAIKFDKQDWHIFALFS